MAIMLMAKPTKNVLRMYPQAISAGDMGVTSTSRILPVDRSSTMVWREPADAVTGTIASIPAITQASTRLDMPSMSG